MLISLLWSLYNAMYYVILNHSIPIIPIIFKSGENLDNNFKKTPRLLAIFYILYHSAGDSFGTFVAPIIRHCVV